ncbi:MAG: UDP-glucose/GDP-mannose dehydrogenase family protein [Bacteroidetes bacterium]|nr:UDP-glucose/GDP-mannose dehydrogenase family protein [Bacteroidota bacterium]
MKVGFVGLGKLGLPCAEVFSEHYDVMGFDIKPVTGSSIKIAKDVRTLVDHADMIFVSVPTPHLDGYDGSSPSSHLPPMDFDYTFVKESLQELDRYCTPEKTVVLISTVLPGTISRELDQIVRNGTLIYNPYLIAMGTVKWDMAHPEMIILGNRSGKEDERILQLRKMYNTISVDPPRIVFGTWEEAESIKIFYNTFISAKIGLVNMIQDVAEKLGNMNVDVVTSALMESTHRITGPAYMKAGLGDGGPCHPRDNIALRYLADELDLDYDLFAVIMESREVQARHMAKRCAMFGQPVVILGSSYKPNVSLTDGSYALLVGHYLSEMGTEVTYDAIPSGDHPKTYLICHEGQFNDHPFKSGSTIVDPWRSFRSERKDLSIYWYGNTRDKQQL